MTDGTIRHCSVPGHFPSCVNGQAQITFSSHPIQRLPRWHRKENVCTLHFSTFLPGEWPGTKCSPSWAAEILWVTWKTERLHSVPGHFPSQGNGPAWSVISWQAREVVCVCGGGVKGSSLLIPQQQPPKVLGLGTKDTSCLGCQQP